MRLSKQVLEYQIRDINQSLKISSHSPNAYLLDKDTTGYQLQQFTGNDGTTNSLSARLTVNEMHHLLLGMLISL